MVISGENLTLKEFSIPRGQAWSNGTEGIIFLFFTEGSALYQAPGLSQAVGQGDILVANSKLAGHVSAQGRQGVKGHHFYTHFEALIALFNAREICLLEKVANNFKTIRRFHAKLPVVRRCHALLESAPSQLTLEHRCHMLRIVAALLGDEFKAISEEKNGSEQTTDHVVQVLEAMSASELQELSVDDIARRFGCSRRHLNRLFHEQFGTSVGALKMEMRLLKAATLLKDPNAKVINVAMDCGFNHLGLFSTVFKKRFGISPGKWRHQELTAECPPPALRGGDSRDAHPTCRVCTKDLCPWNRASGLIPAGGAAVRRVEAAP
jgi:AraC-like DNA-binding protein